MGDFPPLYEKSSYADWHNKYIEPGGDIVQEVEAVLTQLKDSQRDRLHTLAELMSRVNSFLRLAQKFRGQDISDSKTEFLIEAALKSDDYEKLFKGVDSVLDKLWRKNKVRTPGEFVTSKTLHSEIGDLIRTSVVTSTFSYARDFSKSFSMWQDLAKELQLNSSLYEDIQSVQLQEESKMQNGYFAFHLDVRYCDGIRVEVQVYSRLSAVWRYLSHKLYEKVRLGEDVEWGHGTAASRMVSLGHLLHLAECELEYLKDSLK